MMGFLPILIAIAALFFAILFLHHSLRHASSLKHPRLPPGSLGFPLIGESFPYLAAQRANTPEKFFQSRAAKYGAVFKTSLIGHPTVVLTGASGTRFLFANENKLVRNSWPSSTIALLGEHALIGKHGEEHRRLRQLVMACLCPEALEKFMARVDDLTERHFAEYWDGKEQVTLFPLIKMHSMSSACSLLISLDDHAQKAKLIGLFKTILKGVMQLPIPLPWTLYRKAQIARAAVKRELDGIIEQRRMAIETLEYSTVKDLVSILLTAKDEVGGSLSHKEIEDTVLLLLFAGYDTTSSTLALVCKFVAENPTCCEMVLQEQLEIAGSKEGGQKLSWEDVKKMKYTWTVVEETLRLQPPVAGGFKVCLKDIEFEGYSIPSGWKLCYSSHHIHHNEQYFPDPHKFDPSRFEGSGPVPYTFVPFGGGPHKCPGIEYAKMTMLVFVHHLVRRFHWTLADPNEVLTLDPFPRPEKGLPIRLVKRGGPK